MRISKKLLFAIAAGGVLSISLGLHAALHPPLLPTTVNIPYQGYLQQNGIPYPGGGAGITIAVSLYDGTAATPFFTDTFPAVQVNGGHFGVVLGQAAGNPLLPGFFNGTPVSSGGGTVTVAGPIMVGVSVGGNQLSGKQTLFPAPYAQVAAYANQSADTFSVGTSLSVGSGVNAASATLTGALSAGSATVSGALSAASASLTGGVSAATVHATNFDSCPANYTLIALPHSTLCVQNMVVNNNYMVAQDDCNAQAGGRLCTVQQLRRYCSVKGSNSVTASSWLADRVGDDGAVVTNGTACDNFDGTTDSRGSWPNAYCCLEWMKYY